MRGMYLMRQAKTEEDPKEKDGRLTATSAATPRTVRDVVIPRSVRKDMRYCLTAGVISFMVGFALWNVDNVFCGNVTALKRAVGWPGAFLIEGHAWWHVCTVSTGSHLSVVLRSANQWMLFRVMERSLFSLGFLVRPCVFLFLGLLIDGLRTIHRYVG